jgi:hypothetical protein
MTRSGYGYAKYKTLETFQAMEMLWRVSTIVNLIDPVR